MLAHPLPQPRARGLDGLARESGPDGSVFTGRALQKESRDVIELQGDRVTEEEEVLGPMHMHEGVDMPSYAEEPPGHHWCGTGMVMSLGESRFRRGCVLISSCVHMSS